MERMRGGEAVVRTLEQLGVCHVFGHPGHGNTNILDALADSRQISFKLVRHEQAAAHAADGYARVLGRTGVACTSVGPGAANLLMGLASAAAASSPVVAMSGGVIRRWIGRGQLQETTRSEAPADQCFVQAVRPLVKKAWEVREARHLPWLLWRAFGVALSNRPGPVFLEIPWDLQAEFDDFEMPPTPLEAVYRRIVADPEGIDAACACLAAAERPVIVAGNGATLSGAGEAILALAEILGAPVATSVIAKGLIPEEHPLSLGAVGWFGHPAAHEYIRNHADWVLALGFRFSDLATCWWTEGMPFVRENRFIQVDVDAEEIGRNVPVVVGLQGDVALTVREMVRRLPARREASKVEERRRRIAEVKSRLEPRPLAAANRTPLEPRRVAQELRKAIPRDAIVAIDTGSHAHYFSVGFPVSEPRTYLAAGNWTPMGFAPTAILGAKLAAPGRPCISVSGDGGFLMVCQEVVTAVEWGVPVIWVVFNNQGLGAIREGQVAAFGGRIIGTEFTHRTDFSALARSMGAQGLTVRAYDEVGAAIRQALQSGQPTVIDTAVELAPAPPPIAGEWCEPVRGWLKAAPRGTAVSAA